MSHIVIVGGGAGGLELAKYLATKPKIRVTLIDQSPTHLWKPLLHEVAAGTLNSYADELNYLTFATQNKFEFCLGTFVHLQRSTKTLQLKALKNTAGIEIVPERCIAYDILVVAVGSVVNDFNIPGVAEYCVSLDERLQADYFHQLFVQKLIRIDYQNRAGQEIIQPLTIVVIGGGATGVELIAELRSAIGQAIDCGLTLKLSNIQLMLIESRERLLSPLSKVISVWALEQLRSLNIHVLLNKTVSEVKATGVVLQFDTFIAADLCVWTAGIKAPDFLNTLDGLEVNPLNQLCVKLTLQTTKDNDVFALGDCASCPQGIGQPSVPPRAQAAHEQAHFLAKTIMQYLKHKPLSSFQYRDYGSLVSLGQEKTIGNLKHGNVKIMLRGKMARIAYAALYKSHQVALHGVWRVLLLTLANLLSHRVKARFKCH